MRKRLSWDEDKVAQLEKKADPYTMNQDHKNPPVQKYQTGDPSTWAEDPHMATPWKTEGRTETGHPAPAREAVVAARKLEDKAIKCITIAQRMLPGASDEIVEEQATDLMYLPERSVMATLQRQSELAEVISGEGEKEAGKKEDEEEEKEDKEAKGKGCDKEETTPEPEKKEAEEEKEAGKKEEEAVPEEEKEEKKEAAPEEKKEAAPEEKKVAAPEEKKEAEEAAPEEKKEAQAPAEEEKKDEEEKPEEKKADLLDQIFENTEKTGAKKLSGIVKQASGQHDLNNLWDAPPDVSKAFNPTK
jgi:hypothetical protein